MISLGDLGDRGTSSSRPTTPNPLLCQEVDGGGCGEERTPCGGDDDAWIHHHCRSFLWNKCTTLRFHERNYPSSSTTILLHSNSYFFVLHSSPSLCYTLAIDLPALLRAYRRYNNCSASGLLTSCDSLPDVCGTASLF